MKGPAAKDFRAILRPEKPGRTTGGQIQITSVVNDTEQKEMPPQRPIGLEASYSLEKKMVGRNGFEPLKA
jgi:hypothetical protein